VEGTATRSLPSSAAKPGTLRVITLAPHLAELVFAVGAGDTLVGVSAYTDYPAAAAMLPRIGDAFIVDQEQLAVLHPDLLLAWESGTPAHVVDELRGRGFRVEAIRTRGLADVAAALQEVGEITGHAAQGRDAAAAFRDGLASLTETFRGAEPIRVFYQVSSRPLYTINGEHFVSELVALCGGTNVFADLNDIAPLVSVEAVIARNPEVMLSAGDGGEDVFAEWQRWPNMPANRYGNQFYLDAAEIGRATPRLLNAGSALCDALQVGRRNKAAVEIEP
jgi:iron complex transport system substrate-binding protein